jgi:hypothetical protein
MGDPADIVESDPTPAPARRPDTLFITDAELIRRMGVPEKIAYQALHVLDKNPASGFPKKQKLWGDRRYYPAVRAYFDHLYLPKTIR